MGFSRVSTRKEQAPRESRAQLVVLEGDEGASRVRHWLSRDEHHRAQSMTHRGSRERFILGRALLRSAVQEFWGIAPAEVHVDTNGKPRVRGAGGRDCNLSHTRGGVVVALGQGEVGVDVEHRDRSLHNLMELAERTFSPGEAEWVLAGECRDRFLKMWTLKEAYMKAKGLGFRLDPRSFTVVLSGSPPRLESPVGHWVLESTTVGELQIGVAIGGDHTEQGVVLERYDGRRLLEREHFG